MPVKEADLVVQPSRDLQSASFNMTSAVVGRSMRTVTIFIKPLSWRDAEDACKQQGSELFVATNHQDICAVSNAAAKAMRLLGSSVMSDMWLGAIKPANSSNWVWGTSATAKKGLVIKDLESEVPPWTPGEPNGPETEELCLEMKVRSNLLYSAWLNDATCTEKRAYACSSTWW